MATGKHGGLPLGLGTGGIGGVGEAEPRQGSIFLCWGWVVQPGTTPHFQEARLDAFSWQWDQREKILPGIIP